MRFHKLIATGLGTGYAPIAPGTAGALLGIIGLFFFNKGLTMINLSHTGILLSNLVLLTATTILSIYSVSKVHSIWKHDAQIIVIDEIIGVWIAALCLPLQWEYYFLAFVLFRFFDIAKPLFIKRIDRLNNHWSVIFDDVLAGIYALIILQAGIYLSKQFIW